MIRQSHDSGLSQKRGERIQSHMKAQESRFSDHKQEGRSHIHIQQKAATDAYQDIKNQADRKETNIGLVDAVGSGLGSLFDCFLLVRILHKFHL